MQFSVELVYLNQHMDVELQNNDKYFINEQQNILNIYLLVTFW